MTVPRRVRRCPPLAAALAGVLLLAACTGVPTSSDPQTIEALPRGTSAPAASINPTPGENPVQIVKDYLLAAASEPTDTSAAREFLTQAARQQGGQSEVTIVDDVQVGTYSSGSVVVVGHQLGVVNASGVYKPLLYGNGDGGGAQQTTFTFKIATVNGQFRISQTPPNVGLLLTAGQFYSAFHQYPIYFFDASDSVLVPDLRWTAITGQGSIFTWMVTQLVNGPNADLQGAVSTDSVPAQLNPERTSVVANPNGGWSVDIPGASQLPAGAKNRLAAQLAYSFATVATVPTPELTIVDGKSPVTVAQVNGYQFTESDFLGQAGPSQPAPQVYFLREGRIYTGSVSPLPGPLGNGTYNLSSIALAQPAPSGPLLVAADATAKGGRQELYVGTTTGGLKAVPQVSGQLTRPAFVPGFLPGSRPPLSEVWVGAGSKIYAQPLSSTGVPVGGPISVGLPAQVGGGQIVSLRISPEGARIAMVVTGAGGTSRLYVGTIVRNGGQISIVSSQVPLSPQAAVVRDVAWLDATQLVAIGYLSGPEDQRIFQVLVDGADWQNQSTNLASPPDSVTAATSQPVWVSAGDDTAGNFVWVQNSSSWLPPGPSGGQVPGGDPIYLQ